DAAVAVRDFLLAVDVHWQPRNQGRQGVASGRVLGLPRAGLNERIPGRPRHTLPLSGWEPVYDDRDARWFDIKETALHGSYSWALQDYRSEREEVPVPGDVWRGEIPSDVELAPVLTCRDLVKQVRHDGMAE
ncbi:hypothetical protein VOLCADRAFT_101270, partial [Volvox carteri f. nagariensis]